MHDETIALQMDREGFLLLSFQEKVTGDLCCHHSRHVQSEFELYNPLLLNTLYNTLNKWIMR
jgi:hypothetical protein